ncbi:MAG: hypothetical protein Kow00117_09370 [Phototrophicales bacterium]|nr:MAG: hypothetical protein D6711_17280 [Chloroflexota bacterium]
MINLDKTRVILNEAARLVELTATFQARYGKNYVMHMGTPQDALDLNECILDSQAIIANLIEPEIKVTPHYRYGKWWERSQVMTNCTAQQLMTEACRLMSAVAHFEAKHQQGKATWDHAITTTQSAIAGMLHPSTLQVVTNPEDTHPEMDHHIHLSAS